MDCDKHVWVLYLLLLHILGYRRRAGDWSHRHRRGGGRISVAIADNLFADDRPALVPETDQHRGAFCTQEHHGHLRRCACNKIRSRHFKAHTDAHVRTNKAGNCEKCKHWLEV